jgi:CHAT domain-containing protein
MVKREMRLELYKIIIHGKALYDKQCFTTFCVLCFFLLTIVMQSCSNQKNKILTTSKKTFTFFANTDSLEPLNQCFREIEKALSKKDTVALYTAIDTTYKTGRALDDSGKISPSEKNLIWIENLMNVLDKAGDSILTINEKEKNLARLVPFYIYCIYDDQDSQQKTIAICEKYLTESVSKKILPTSWADMLNSLGIAYHKVGEVKKAEIAYREAITLAKELNNKDTISLAEKLFYYNLIVRATRNLCIILNDNNQQDSTIYYANQIINQPMETEYKASLSLSLAEAYIAKKDFVKAIAFANQSLNSLQAIDTAERPENYTERLANTYKIFADIYEAQNDYTKADAAYKSALQYRLLDDSLGRDLAKLYIAIGNYKELFPQSSFTLSPLAYYNKALKALQNDFNEKDSLALPNINRLTPENTYFEALDAKADYLYKKDATNTNTLKKILEYYTASFKVERLLLNSFVYDDSKISFLNESRDRTHKALKICYTLYNSSKEPQWLDKAFQYIENNKATVLSQKIKENKITTGALLEDSLVVKQKTIKKQLTDAQEEKNKGLAATNASMLDSTINALTKEEESLTNLLKEKYPNLNQLYSFNDSATIAQIQESLPDHTGLVQYFYNDSILYTIAINNKQVLFTQKPLDGTAITQFKQNCGDLTMQLNTPQLFLTAAQNVYTNIFPQGFFTNATTAIILIPDGVLNGLNFDALIEKGLISTNYKQQAFLNNRYGFSYCFSYTSLLQKNEQNSTANNGAIIAFAPACTKALDNKAVLPYTQQEVAAIQKSFTNCKSFVGSAATRDQFIKTYANAAIIHLATHSQADPINGNSSLDFYDEKMFTNQFYAYNDFKANLVFLSACETTLGRNTESEGVLSLARSIYCAGAQNVISAQWSINDQSTNTIVENFYSNTKENDYGMALQKAKQQYLKTCSPEKAAPYYWAALIHTGVTKNTTANLTVLLLYVAAFILAVGIAFFVLRRKTSSKKNKNWIRKKTNPYSFTLFLYLTALYPSSILFFEIVVCRYG